MDCGLVTANKIFLLKIVYTNHIIFNVDKIQLNTYITDFYIFSLFFKTFFVTLNSALEI